MDTPQPQTESIKGLESFLLSYPESVVPSLVSLKAVIGANLVLANPGYPRTEAIDAVANMVYGWIGTFGIKVAVRMVREFLTDRVSTRGVSDDAKHLHDSGDGGDAGKPAGVHDDAVLREGNTGAHGRPAFQIINGGGSQGAPSGDTTAEPSAGSAHKEPAGGISKRLVELELSEHKADLRVFQKAYSLIKARVVDVQDDGRLMKLANWSGTAAVLGLLELVTHNIERVVGELKDILAKLDVGTIPNLDEE